MQDANPVYSLSPSPCDALAFESNPSCDFTGQLAGNKSDHEDDEETFTVMSEQDRERAEKASGQIRLRTPVRSC